MDTATRQTRNHGRTELLKARVNPTLADQVRGLVGQTLGADEVQNEADAVRWALKEGTKAKESGRRPAPELSRPQYAERAAGLIDAYSDLLARAESHDPEAALLLADGLAKTSAQYARELRKRVGK